MALVEYDFTDVVLLSRASAATYRDAAGVRLDAAASVPRFDHDFAGVYQGLLIEEASTNVITNTGGVGAISGTPGTDPNGWALSGGSGITKSIVGSGVDAKGRRYVDVGLAGTASSTGPLFFYFEAATNVEANAALGEVWTGSLGAQIMAGSMAGISSVQQVITELTGAGVNIASQFGSSLAVNGSYQAFAQTVTLAQATVGRIRPGLRFVLVNGAAITLTIRIIEPQLEKKPRASVSSMRPAEGVVAAVARAEDDVRIRNVASWLRASTNTLLVEFKLPATALAGQDQGIFRLDDGTDDNVISLRNVAGTNDMRWRIVAGGVQLCDLSIGSIAAGGVARAAMAFGTNPGTGAHRAAGALTGGAVSFATLASAPPGSAVLNRAILGRSRLNAGVGNTAAMANGWIRFVGCYDRILIDDLLPDVTSLNRSISVLLTEGGAVLSP